MSSRELSVFNRTFWDFWLQKILRNLASVKYQFMVAFFWLVAYGMFIERGDSGVTFISATAGLTFLGGGFITLVTSRLVIRTSLFEPKENNKENNKLDTDK